MKQDLRIAIVDDNRDTLINLEELLSFDSDISEIITYNSGLDFIKKLKLQEKEFHPKVVLMDIDMPNMNGIQTVLISKAQFPHINFIMLSIHDDENFLFQAIKAGASGYLLKDEKLSTIITQIKLLQNEGGAPMSPIIAKRTMELIQKMSSPLNQKDENIKTNLSERELEVLKLLVNGSSYNNIAEQLFISINTVKKHIGSIYSKLHVTSKAQAIKMAHFYGIS